MLLQIFLLTLYLLIQIINSLRHTSVRKPKGLAVHISILI
jgi:hypothetical protein